MQTSPLYFISFSYHKIGKKSDSPDLAATSYRVNAQYYFLIKNLIEKGDPKISFYCTKNILSFLYLFSSFLVTNVLSHINFLTDIKSVLLCLEWVRGKYFTTIMNLEYISCYHLVFLKYLEPFIVSGFSYSS